MMIALPNMDGSFTVTCFFPFDGPDGFDFLDNASDEQVANYFKKNYPDAFALMPGLLNDFRSNPTSALVTVKCFPWSLQDKFCLFGKSDMNLNAYDKAMPLMQLYLSLDKA